MIEFLLITAGIALWKGLLVGCAMLPKIAIPIGRASPEDACWNPVR